MTKFEQANLRAFLAHYPTGVCAITAMVDDVPAGMIVGSFTSASLTPPLIAFFPDKRSTSWPKIERAKTFCVNVLADHQQNLCQALSAKEGDKFAGVAYEISEYGAPILKGALAWLECKLHSVFEAGDHFVALGEIIDLEAGCASGGPLIFFRGRYGGFSLLGVNRSAG